MKHRISNYSYTITLSAASAIKLRFVRMNSASYLHQTERSPSSSDHYPGFDQRVSTTLMGPLRSQVRNSRHVRSSNFKTLISVDRQCQPASIIFMFWPNSTGRLNRRSFNRCWKHLIELYRRLSIINHLSQALHSPTNFKRLKPIAVGFLPSTHFENNSSTYQSWDKYSQTQKVQIQSNKVGATGIFLSELEKKNIGKADKYSNDFEQVKQKVQSLSEGSEQEISLCNTSESPGKAITCYIR